MNTLTAARQLAAALSLIVDRPDKTFEGRRCAVHLDQTKALASLNDGRHAILIGPPRVTFGTYTTATATWPVLLIANPPADRLKAWAALDGLLEAVRVDLDVATADPAEFQPVPTITPYAAYELAAPIEYDLD